MRGGAIPVLAWATLLLILFAGNWITDDRGVNPAVAGFAALVIYAIGVALILARREAIRRGAPPSSGDAEAEPDASVAAVIVGLSVGCILFGLVWARFLVYFGAAMLVLALGRMAVELRAERRTLARAKDIREPSE